MDDAVIRIRDLSKSYRMGTFLPYGRVTESVSNFFRRPFHRSKESPEWIWALRNVNLDVRQGEVLGVIGRNGAGKTTLLKILSRITDPTEGIVELHGRVGSLLEVGTGFHPELTGRENVYLNGAILGMRREEIRRKFDPIVEFSEIDRFLDTPVKRYSSGMYIRLAFAVAAHLEPEILLVDEVLAVGDASFQAKCLGRLNDIAHEGRTVVFVSHNMGAITKLCTRVCWIDGGRLVADGAASDVVAKYLAASVSGDATWSAEDSREPDPGSSPAEDSSDHISDDRTELRLTAACVRDAAGQPSAAVPFDQPFRVDVSYRVDDPIRDAAVVVLLIDASGNNVLESWDTDSSTERTS